MGEDNAAHRAAPARHPDRRSAPAAREYANELRSSRNPAVRRAAIDLLRALGGDAALPDLRAMLDDADPQVQREALRAIVQIGTDEAYQMLEQALKQRRAAHARRDHAGARRVPRREGGAAVRPHPRAHRLHAARSKAVYIADDRIARQASRTDDRSVAALKEILYRGEWWAPGRTGPHPHRRGARAAQHRARRAPTARSKKPPSTGPRGVRKIAKAALAEPAPPRRADRRRSQ